jgi:hypothetical protein
MKFLQIKNTENGEPKILESFKDFDLFSDNALIICLSKYDDGRSFYENNEVYFQRICLLDDCYKSRPLIEIDGFCEYNLYLHTDFEQDEDRDEYMNILIYEKPNSRFIFINKECESDEDGVWCNGTSDEIYPIEDTKDYKDYGSIFLPKNKEKYPELYQEALKIINQ